MQHAITRRTAIKSAALGTAAAGVFGIRRAHAAEFSFKVGTDIPEAAPLNVFLHQAADAILKETGGRVELKIYANNVLGGDPAMFSQLRSGALECFLVSGINVLSALIPKASIYGLGFAFKDDRMVYDALDGDLGAALRKQIAAANFVVMDRIWANGFRQITSATENEQLRQRLSTQGLVFNDVDRGEFIEKLRTSGYYAQWKTTFGDELWGQLEKCTGKLA